MERIFVANFLRRLRLLCCAITIAVYAAPVAAQWTPPDNSGTPGGPVIEIEDVNRFYAVYDSAGGHPSATQLQSDYLNRASEGLRRFAELRDVTAARIAASLSSEPDIYSDARRCAAVLPEVRNRLRVAMRKLAEIYPEARFPAITITVGRGKPVGVGGPNDGVMIGLEALCGVTYFDPDISDRFLHVIAHEYIHVQQPASLTDDEHPTVLEASLMEGAAEFVGEMISGGVAEPGVWREAKGHVNEIDTAFVHDEESNDLSKWLFNGTLDRPGDLGYWVGYQIVKSYYRHAGDKRRAIREILQMSNPKGFLARSGWRADLRKR